MKYLFFTLFSLMVCTMLRAYDAKIDGIYYNLSRNKATVTYRDAFYDSYKGDLVIPESISYNGKTYSVTSIGHLAISNCTSLNSITIPKSITTIEKSAFYWWQQDC